MGIDTDVIEKIYESFLLNYDDFNYVFLCGCGDKNSMRNKVRKVLVENKCHVLYPEDLFVEEFNRTKRQKSLLEYESFLASNVDIICIIVESIGSAAELGAFVQDKELFPKVIACTDVKYEKKNSFINLGPILKLKNDKESKSCRVLNYDAKTDNGDFYRSLVRTIRKVSKKRIGKKFFDNFSDYIIFISLVIYFYKDIEKFKLKRSIKKFLNDKGIPVDTYSDSFEATIRYLLKLKWIAFSSVNESEKEMVTLTNIGAKEISNIWNNTFISSKSNLHDRIRCDILYQRYK